MPRRYTKKANKRPRRRYGKKRKKKAREVGLLSPSNGYGLAAKALMKFRWAQYNNIQHATLPYAEHVYRMNSIHDPDYTGAGTQPVQHDDLAALFDRYKVYDCYAKITISNLTADMPVIISVSRLLADPSGHIDTYANVIPMHSKDTKVRTLQPYGSGSDKSSTTVVMRTSLRKFFKPFFNDINAQAAMNANPSSSPFLWVTAQSLDSSTPVQTRVNVEFMFNTCLFARDVAQSITLD